MLQRQESIILILNKNGMKIQVRGIVLAELIACIEKTRSDVFKVYGLAQLYSDRLNQLGVHITIPVNVKTFKR